jgi:hypothetical protein
MMHEHSNHHETSLHTCRSSRGTPDWQRAHQELSQLARSRARLDWEEGRLLLDALRSGAHQHLGFGGFGEYVERMLGYNRRTTEERLRVAEALERLPELGQALREGTLSWSCVRELTRVATADNERAWIEVAKGRTLRQVEELVTGHRSGDKPDDPYDPSLRRHVLRFEVSAETYATFRDAMAKLRRDAGSSLDDDASLLLLARQILGGPTDEGRAAYQVALTVCQECGRGWQQARGELVEVGSEIVEMAHCDAQHLDRINAHVGGQPTKARQNVTPALRRKVMRRDSGKCVVPGCGHGVFLDLHHVELRSEGGDHGEDNLITLCSAHHRAMHRGQLIIEGRVSAGLVFRHADGAIYGRTADPRTVGVFEQAFLALRSLGFREGEARSALDRVRADPHVGDSSVETILRQALAFLATR